MNQDNGLLLQELTAAGVLRLTLNDVKRRNALSEDMIKTLSETFGAAASNPDVRVIVLAANGPAFCAGHNLKEMTAARDANDGGEAYYAKIMTMCSEMMQSIVRNPKPVIAEIAGVATAAGCQLVASCDLAVAAKSAVFATPGVHIGLFCSTPMVALSRNLSNKHAMEMLLTGDLVKAKKAQKIGLVNKVAKDNQLTEKAMEMASKIASKSSMTLAIGKRAFYDQKEMELSEAYQFASNVMVENMLKHDAEEGINAFIEKRPAQWQDS